MKCEKCNKDGHATAVCKATGKKQSEKASEENKKDKKSGKKKKAYSVENTNPDSDNNSDEDYTFYINCINKGREINDCVTVEIGGVEVEMLIDSGANCNVINKTEWERCKSEKIQVSNMGKSKRTLKVYGAEKLDVIGTFTTDMKLKLNKAEIKNIEVLVIDAPGRPILGKEAARALGILKMGAECLEETGISYIESEDIVQRYPKVFTGGQDRLGKLKDFQLEIPINEKITPVAQHPRRVPYQLREKVNKKIQELLRQDIIEPVEGPTPWVSPMVIVQKKNGEIRLCIDMRRANEAVVRERFQLPTFEEILQELRGSVIFSKLDIKWAYHQIELTPESREITTFSTQKGLYRYKRLNFGISCAPEMFQRVIQNTIAEEGVINFLDDIIVCGKTVQEHDQRLSRLLEKLQDKGLTLNAEKCEFRKTELKFLGHHVSSEGIRPSKSNLETIQEFREPGSAKEVQSFLGLVNFCARFIPNLATINEPLREVIKKSKSFEWGPKQKEAFEKLKKELTKKRVLSFFDKDANTKIVVDASPVGLGAVLIQEKGGNSRIVAYASRSLTDVEKRYSPTEKEALAIVWGFERFQMYLLGREFELISDHKPLECIYGKRSKPCARIERWVLRMQPYQYKLIYQPGKLNIADPLSRLLKIKHVEPKQDDYVKWIAEQATPKAMTTREIERASEEDDTLREVRRGLKSGVMGEHLRPYKLIQEELCYIGYIILRGNRIIVPEAFRTRVMEIAHEGHPGITAMKARLRSKVWWPKIDRNVEDFVKTCHGCQLVAQINPPEPMTRTELPSRPWEHVAIDFLGPLPSQEYLMVVVDYYSRYIEIAWMKTITTTKMLKNLNEIFSRFGYPVSIHSDNGPQFISSEYEEYMKNRGIEVHRVTPLWPQANGEIERQNRSILKRLKIAKTENRDMKEELQTYLLTYRATPHSVTGVTPAELLFIREIRTKLPEFNTRILDDETVRDRDREKKDQGKEYSDARRRAKERDLQPGDQVIIKQPKIDKLTTTFSPHKYVLVNKNGNAVELRSETGKTVRRNSTQVAKYQARTPNTKEQDSNGPEETEAEPKGIPKEREHEAIRSPGQRQLQTMKANTPQGKVPEEGPTSEDRRPVRIRQMPKYLQDYELNQN